MADRADQEPARPSPEALLAAASKEGRGRLKVFLGAAPGVGKTYAMLQSGRRAKADGADIVVGIVETHGRRETEDLLAGLEILPRRAVEYQGRVLTELDLDAALKRKPKLVLVDELAHTNAPGSRHPKRYQDVGELLDAGIDVHTTLNVQHLESLNDVVQKITRIRVRETLPDRVLEEADEVELVDITPEELIKRLKEGKVYVPGNAQRALDHFFKAGNLTALRELALRRTAERVDSQMVDYMRRHAIEGPWPAGERILVCVGPDPLGPELVRTARRMADLMSGYWVALHVERPGQAGLAEAEQARVDETLRLAEHLGGEAVRILGDDLPGELLRYARGHNITQVVLGRVRSSRWAVLTRRSLVHEVVRRSSGIAVHVITGEPGEAAAPVPDRRPAAEGWLPASLAATAAVAAAVGVAVGIDAMLDLPNLSMIFLASVLFCAIRYGMAASVLASLLSFLAYNFFLIEPRYTFSVSDGSDLLSLLVFLAVAILTSGLAGRARDHAAAMRARFKSTQALYDFSRKLGATARADDLLWAVAQQVAAAAGGRSVVLQPETGELALAAAFPPDEALEVADWAAARWAWENGEVAGRDSATLPSVKWQFRPVRTARGMVAVVGVRPKDDGRALRSEELRMLDALLDQAAVALERADLVAEAAEAEAIAQTERLRTALLSSISHDLRTPLASILGSATSLLAYGESFSPAAQRDLLVTIRDETERLSRFVANLLDMTRVESGALEIKRDWVDIAELCGSAAGRVAGFLGARRLQRSVAADLPLLRLDFALMEQVLFNLLDNAVKYGPDGSAIALRAARDGNAVTIAVEDEGPGIPPGDLERVFDKFYRVHRGDAAVAGTGLGLSICRGIVEALGGTIRARSPVRAGRGTAVEIRFPAPAADAAPAAAGAERPVA
ncbi:MAG: sensor histidine kinase KdpD [Alphaproteobacteria bacterium]|nr:sensor histidine kinase KdpD [Alphaproteobacteria bacterium]